MRSSMQVPRMAGAHTLRGRVLHALAGLDLLRQSIGRLTASRLARLFAIGGATSAAYLSGALNFLDYELQDLRFRMLPRAASGDLVLVAIDNRSLTDIDTWPWPRSYYAIAIDTLLDAGAERVALDIDLSATSTPMEDALLEEALARAGDRVVLPVFRSSDAQASLTLPLARFRRQAQLAHIEVVPDTDGLVRHLPLIDPTIEAAPPSLSLLLAESSPSAVRNLNIDYGIRPESIPHASFIDVFRADLPADMFAGKQVLIGSTAPQLGDQLAVPLHGVLPGSYIVAMGAETLTQHRAIRPLAPAPVLLISLALGLLTSAPIERRGWGGDALMLLAVTVGAVAIATGLQAAFAISIDLAPMLMCAGLAYAASTVLRIDELAGQLRAQRRRAADLRDTNQTLATAKAELERIALHDALTGLPNRALLFDRLTQTLELAQRERRPFAVCVFDLDGFKQINDTLGHQSGDAALRAIAGRARRVLRRSDTVGRLGGDEFVAILPTASNISGALVAARKIADAIVRPIGLGNTVARVGASIGVAVFPHHGADPETLLQHADQAMYQAKALGGGVCLFTETQNAETDATAAGTAGTALARTA